MGLGSMEFGVVTLEGDLAVTAWRAYLGNRTRFGKRKRDYAVQLAVPDVAYFAVPCHVTKFMASLQGHAKDIGDGAAAVLSLGPLHGNSKTIRYVHTRENFLGSGLASKLLDKAKQDMSNMPRPGVLFATAEACRTRDASLFLLRNQFRCDISLGDADIPDSDGAITGKTSVLDFSWDAGSTSVDHLVFLSTVLDTMAKRRTKRASHWEYMDSFRDVYVAYAKQVGSADHPWPSASQQCPSEPCTVERPAASQKCPSERPAAAPDTGEIPADSAGGGSGAAAANVMGIAADAVPGGATAEARAATAERLHALECYWADTDETALAGTMYTYEHIDELVPLVTSCIEDPHDKITLRLPGMTFVFGTSVHGPYYYSQGIPDIIDTAKRTADGGATISAAIQNAKRLRNESARADLELARLLRGLP